MATLYEEEELMGAKEFILENDYETVLKDITHGDEIKVYLWLLLNTDTKKWPDLIQSAEIFDSMFMRKSNLTESTIVARSTYCVDRSSSFHDQIAEYQWATMCNTDNDTDEWPSQTVEPQNLT